METVWRRLSDVVSWSQWTPTVTEVEALDGPDLKQGRRFRVHQPRLRPAIWSVTLMEAPSSFTWEARAPGVVMIAEHILERTASGRTGLTLTFSFQGVLGPLIGWSYRKLVQSYLDTEADSLRRHAEADAARGSGAA